MSEFFKDLAHAESEDMMKNICENLRRCLQARGLSHSDFIKWAVQQNVEEVRVSKLRMYYSGKIKSDHLSAICLTATYMSKAPQQVLLEILPRESFK